VAAKNVVERSSCSGPSLYGVSLGGPEKTMMREFLVSDYQNRIMGDGKTDQAESSRMLLTMLGDGKMADAE
jgi:hypothetical protein